MEKLKNFFNLFLSMFGCFVIGLYASSTFKYNEPIELSRWILAIFFSLFFLLLFLKQFKK